MKSCYPEREGTAILAFFPVYISLNLASIKIRFCWQKPNTEREGIIVLAFCFFFRFISV